MLPREKNIKNNYKIFRATDQSKQFDVSGKDMCIKMYNMM